MRYALYCFIIRAIERIRPIRQWTGPCRPGPNGPDRTGLQILQTSKIEVLVLLYVDRGPNRPVYELFIFFSKNYFLLFEI